MRTAVVGNSASTNSAWSSAPTPSSSAGRPHPVRPAGDQPALPQARAQTAEAAQHPPALLRHYSATELVAAGVDIRTVAGRLGHGSGGATTLVYAGWVNEADRRAAETMATIVPRPVPAPTAPRGPYEVIAEALREQIRTGQLKPGDQLPTISCTATEPGLVVVSPLGSSVSGRRGTCGCVR